MKILLLSLLCISSNIFAWGPVGHRVVGEIAEKFMGPSVLAKAKKILAGQSLSRVANWPDEIKSDPANYSYTFKWHHTDWPEGTHEHNEQNSSGSLLSSIKEQLALLQSPQTSKEKKAFALKFLVHLIGDLHQPLHVGSGLDRGGNTCKVFFHSKPVNLHFVWDEGMIDFTHLSYTEMANYVSQGRRPEDIRAWKKGSIVDWARESKELRGEIYPAEVNIKKAQSVRHYCRSDISIPEDEMPKLAYEYSYRFVPTVEKRLFQAGLRLAVLLNENLK